VNFDDAIEAHAGRKIKPADYLKHPGGTIKSGEAGTDNRRLRGQRPHGEAKKIHSFLPQYQTLMTEHRFHRIAGKIAGRVDSGQVVNAEAAPGNGGEFAIASLRAQRAIRTMKANVE
jgi:hypothetical protein